MRTMPLCLMILVSVAKMCAQNVVTNPTSTQTIQGTGATTIPLVVQQTPTGSITFQVLDSAGNVLGQWSAANGQSTPKFNNMIIMDGVKYPYTGAGLQAAINDALALNTGQPVQTSVANGGAVVVIPKPFAIGTTTITNGVLGTGGQQQGGTVAYLWFAAPGQWTCNAPSATSPCFALASRSRVWGMGRFSQIKNTGAGPTFQATSPAEDIEIRDLWLQGGLNAIKTRGSVSGTDVPGLRIRNNFMQEQTGNAVELVSLADNSMIDNNFMNGPGGACLRIGVIDNGAVGQGTNENSTIANNFCQYYGSASAGGRGFHFGSNSSAPEWQAVGWKIDTNQIGPKGANGLDGFFFKGGGDVVEISNTTFVAPVGSATSDALHLEVISGGAGHSNFKVSGVHYGGGGARYGVFWDLLAQNGGASNELDRASVGNGVSASIFVRGNILLKNIQQATTIASTSLFQSKDAFKGGDPITFKNSLDAAITAILDSGSTTSQATSLRFSDRGTRLWDIGTFQLGSNDFGLNSPTTGSVFNVPAGTANISFFGNVTLRSGVNNNGGGFKHGNVTTGSIAAGTRGSVTLTWPTAFADATYNVTCNVLDNASGGSAQGLIFERLNSILAASVSATVFNPTTGALTGKLYCAAVHP